MLPDNVEAAAEEHRADRARRRRRHQGVQGGVRRRVHHCTLDDLARCRAGRALWTRRSRGTGWTLRAGSSIRTGRSCGPGSSRRPGGPLRACRALRPSRTSRPLGTGRACSAGRSVRTGRPYRPGSSRRPGGSLRACRALRPSRTSRPLGTGQARRASRTAWTHRAGRAGSTCSARRARWAGRPARTFSTSRPSRTRRSRTGRAGWPVDGVLSLATALARLDDPEAPGSGRDTCMDVRVPSRPRPRPPAKAQLGGRAAVPPRNSAEGARPAVCAGEDRRARMLGHRWPRQRTLAR